MLPWNEFRQRVDAADRILLTCHVRPDGDALGSELAMAALLRQQGKQVRIFNPSPTPARYQFLDAEHEVGALTVEQPDVLGPEGSFDLLMVLDTGTWSQLARFGDYVRNFAGPRVVLDHHVSQDEDLQALRLVDTRAAACGMLVCEAYDVLGGKWSAAAATAAYVAIAMDTGWFRHPNTCPAVMQTTARLIEAGAEPSPIYRHLFEEGSVGKLRLLSVMLQRLQVAANGRLSYSVVRQADFAETGAHPMDTEDFISTLMSIGGVEAAGLFIEQVGNGTKISVRSRGGVDCSAVTSRYGGGGHRAAAGASVAEPLDRVLPQVLADLERALS